MDRLRLDATHAWRSFRARPAATAALVAVLALGIGVTSTMFALADPFLLKPLPYRDPGRLVVIRPSFAEAVAVDRPEPPLLVDWQGRAELFSGVAAYGEGTELRVQGPSGAIALKATAVSENFLDVLGVRFDSRTWRAPAGGQLRPAAFLHGPRAAALGAPAPPAGQTFAVAGGGVLESAGALDSAFLFPTPRVTRRPDVLTPAAFRETITSSGGRTTFLTGVARLRDGVSPEAAHAAMAASAGDGIAIAVEPLVRFMTSRFRPLALGALAAGLLITLACAANVVNLMVARGVYRTREFATREAIGATRVDLLRLVAVEIAAVTGVAILTSLLFVRAALGFIARVIPAEYTYLGDAEVSARVVLFASLLGLGVVAGGFLAAWPAWRGVRAASINQTLSVEARKVRWTRFAMVAGQSATAMVLLVGGVFLVRSHLNLWSQGTGFSSESVIVSVLYPTSLPPPLLAGQIHETVGHLRRIPGVVAAAATTGPLLDDGASVGGTLMQIGERRMLFAARQITPGYFDATGATPLAGRELRGDDRNWSGVVVNDAFVRRLLPGRTPESAVGEIVTLHQRGALQGRIVGVVPNAHDRALDRAPAPAMYRLLESSGGILAHHFVIRLRDRSARPDEAARQAVSSVNRDGVIVDVAWLDERLAGTVRDRSFATLILALFAVAGLGVTGSGLFGVIAFAVARRTREIAIRRAIGADARQIVRLVVRDAAGAASAGALAGLLLGRWLSRFLESYLFGVAAADALTLTLVAALMLLVVVVAAWVPARRAIVLSPTQALRID